MLFSAFSLGSILSPEMFAWTPGAAPPIAFECSAFDIDLCSSSEEVAESSSFSSDDVEDEVEEDASSESSCRTKIRR